MERTGLNRNFVLSLFNTLFHGFPEYISGGAKETDTDKDSCLNAVLFLWYNIEHHFDGKSQHGAFTVFLRNKNDWNIPEGLLPEQIVENSYKSRSITFDFDLTHIPSFSGLIEILNSLYALSLSHDQYKDPYDEKWYTEENNRIFQGSNSVYVGFPTKEQKCEHVLLLLTERDKDFEGLPWDYGDMSETQQKYIEDLKDCLNLYNDKLSQAFNRFHKFQYDLAVESTRASNKLQESQFELQLELAKASKPIPVSDKYTDEDFREAWKIVLNSPNLSAFWKDYQSMKTWDLLEDDYLLDLLELTLDLFRDREYKDGAKNACDFWIQDLKQPLEILSKKAPLYSSYVNTHSESELSIEKLTELGHLSDDEIEVLQTAGVLAKAIKEPRDYFKLSDLLYRAEFFEAYCEGLKYQLSKGKQPLDTLNPDELKKSIIYRLRDSGLITASKYPKDEKHYYYFVTDKFTPDNIKTCLSIDRIKWQTIADFEAIIPEPYNKESKYTPIPMTDKQLKNTANNKARKK